MNEFKDIRIVGFDEHKTHNPDKTMGIYDIYFTLSDSPPSAWQEILVAERRFPRHTSWRRAQVVGSHIVLRAPLGEAEMHLQDLREDVTNCNRKYRQHVESEARKKAQQEAKQKAAEDAEKKKLLELKNRLSFDKDAD